MKYVAMIFLGMFVAVGLGFACWGCVLLRRAAASGAWPSVEGRVVRSRVSAMSGENGPTYAPDVGYVYLVDGAERTAARLFVGDSLSTSDGGYARGYCERYPVGKTVSVYYDPDDPDSAVLEPGLTKRSFFVLTFGLGFVFFGGWFGLLLWMFE